MVIYLSVYLSVRLSDCLSIYLSVYLYICLSLSVCLSPPSLSQYIYIYIIYIHIYMRWFRFDLVIPIADTAHRTCEYHASIDAHNINLTCLLTGIHSTVIIFNIDTLVTLFVETICHW